MFWAKVKKIVVQAYKVFRNTNHKMFVCLFFEGLTSGK